MTSTATRSRPRASAWSSLRSRGRRARPNRLTPYADRLADLVPKAGLVLLALAAAWVLWFVGGLLFAAYTIQSKAAAAQGELQLFRDTLQAGDAKTAAIHLDAGARALSLATAASRNDQVRMVHGLPLVGPTVDDLDHLINAANILTRSGQDALAVYDNFSGPDSKLFHDGTFSIPAIESAQVSVGSIEGSIRQARAQLGMVHGRGLLGGTVLAKQQKAEHQVDSLQKQMASLTPLLDALPDAVGANGRKTYVVVIMNPAEMRASGGAPLSVAFVRFTHGTMKIVKKGSTSALTGMNKEFFWNRLTGRKDPFQLPAGQAQRFVNTTLNPSWTTSGEQLLRATPANFGIHTDGVIALDITAIGHLLDATGPLQSQYYGTITGANIAQKLVIDPYVAGNKSDDASVAVRHSVNSELMAVMLSRLTGGGGLLGKVTALGAAIPGRHLQMYFRDPALEQAITEKGMAGTIPVPRTGNLTAVYTQNGNANKLDVFQQRVVHETVQLRPNGSAMVTRTVELANPTPPYTAPFPERFRGYDTRYATNLVINLMPPGAKVVEQPAVPLQADTAKGVDQEGRTYAKAAITLFPNSSSTLTWRYVVKHAAVVQGNRMVFRDVVAPQSMLNTPSLALTVLGPPGWTSLIGTGWQQSPGGVSTTVPMDELRTLSVELRQR